MDYNKKRL